MSLGGSRTFPELLETPWTSQKFPELLQKFPGDLPRTALTVDLKSNQEVPQKFPGLPKKFAGPPKPDLATEVNHSLGILTPSVGSQTLALSDTGQQHVLNQITCWEQGSHVSRAKRREQKKVTLLNIGTGKGVITKGVFSLQNSLESLRSLNSLESQENGRILLRLQSLGGSLKSLRISRNDPFSKRPLFQTREQRVFGGQLL